MNCVPQATGAGAYRPTGWPTKVSHKLLSMSLPNIDRFSNFFYWNILWKICNSGYKTYHRTLTAFERHCCDCHILESDFLVLINFVRAQAFTVFLYNLCDISGFGLDLGLTLP